ncbi:hypothetical protein ACTFIR_005808 [Dictyostelium discoideum]
MKKEVKIVTVGDGLIGKTTLLMTYYTNEFNTKVYSSFDSEYLNPLTVIINDDVIEISIWENDGFDSDGVYKESPPFIKYQPNHINVFLLLFSISDRDSFNNCLTKWNFEIKQNYPSIPVVLCGIKTDLREEENLVYKNSIDNSHFISFSEGVNMANEIDAVGYYECSSLKKKGLSELFDVLAIVGHSNILTKKKDKIKFKNNNNNNNENNENISDTENNDNDNNNNNNNDNENNNNSYKNHNNKTTNKCKIS